MNEEIDIDRLGDDFLNFYVDVDEIIRENEKFKKEQHVTDKRLYVYNTEEKHLNEEIVKLQEIITSYQSMLTDHNKIQEEKRSLKIRIDELCKQKAELEKESNVNNERFLHQVQDLQTKHSNELDKVQRQANELAASEIAVYDGRLNSQLADLESMKMLLVEKDKQRTAEISRLKLEYDTKLQKLQQRQLAQANTSSGSMSARNDIFRKKLQHFQLLSEKEIKTLKLTIAEQQTKLHDLQNELVSGNQQYQGKTKQHQDQLRQQDKVLRQNQTEVRRLQTQLKHEKEKCADLQMMLQKQKADFENEKLLSLSSSKRKKAMFNPNLNYLGAPKS